MASLNIDLNAAKIFGDNDVWCIYETARNFIMEQRPLEDGNASFNDIIEALYKSAAHQINNALADSWE